MQVLLGPRVFLVSFYVHPQSTSGREPAGAEALSPGGAGEPEDLCVISIVIHLDGKGVLRFFGGTES